MSHTSKIGITDPVGFRRPFAEGGEWIIGAGFLSLGQDDPIPVDRIDEFTPHGEAERLAHRRWDRCLCLAGKLARDHCLSQSSVFKRKELPYVRQPACPEAVGR